MEKVEVGSNGIEGDISFLEKMFNNEFVSKIISISIDDYNIRKSALVRLNMNPIESLSKENMKKTFLRCYSKAFDQLYCSDKVYG
jgi:hypothetical protein